jgi:hypothetical protein
MSFEETSRKNSVENKDLSSFLFTNANKNGIVPVFYTDILSSSQFSLARNYKIVPITLIASTFDNSVQPLDIVINTTIETVDRSALYINLQNLDTIATKIKDTPTVITPPKVTSAVK